MPVDLADLISLAEAAEIAGISDRHIRNLLNRGEFPQPLRFGQRALRFRESEVRAWAATYEPLRPGPVPRQRRLPSHAETKVGAH